MRVFFCYLCLALCAVPGIINGAARVCLVTYKTSESLPGIEKESSS